MATFKPHHASACKSLFVYVEAYEAGAVYSDGGVRQHCDAATGGDANLRRPGPNLPIYFFEIATHPGLLHDSDLEF